MEAEAIAKNFEALDKLDVVAVIKYPFVDIELTIRDYDEEEDVLYSDVNVTPLGKLAALKYIYS